VMSADPRLVSQARTISLLTYREISELAYFGAKVVHPKAIRPVIEAGITLLIRNTFNPQHPGTRLIADDAPHENGKVKAVTAIHGQRLITLEGRGMLGVPGVAARAFGAVASTGTSVPSFPRPPPSNLFALRCQPMLPGRWWPHWRRCLSRSWPTAISTACGRQEISPSFPRWVPA